MIFQSEMTFSQGLELTMMAMLIVFSILIIISLILTLFKYIPSEKVGEAKKASTQVMPKPVDKGVNLVELENDEEMLVAGIVASMEASNGKKESNYKITKITKL